MIRQKKLQGLKGDGGGEFRLPLFLTDRDIKVEGLCMGPIFLALFHVHESVYRGRRTPKGNSFIKKKAIISPKLMPAFHFLVE